MPSFPFRSLEPTFLPDNDPRGRTRAFTASIYLAEADMPTFNVMLNELMAKAARHGGDEAMLSPKREAALHEAGHAVVDAAMGLEVDFVSIYRFVDPKRLAMEAALGITGGAWGGATRSPKPWGWNSCTPPEEILLCVQSIISGWCGEWAHDPRGMGGARLGSSIDEILLAQLTLNHLAEKTGVDPKVTFDEQIRIVVDILRANRTVHEALAARLMRKSTVGPEALKRILKDVGAP